MLLRPTLSVCTLMTTSRFLRIAAVVNPARPSPSSEKMMIFLRFLVLAISNMDSV